MQASSVTPAVLCMVRRRRIKHLFAVVTTITLLGIIIIVIELVHKIHENKRSNTQTDINITWQSAHHNDQSTACYTSTISTLTTGDSSVADDVTNGLLNAREFLVEYEKYCSSQLIPKSSNVVVVTATATPVSRSLCPCVPHTLGKQ